MYRWMLELGKEKSLRGYGVKKYYVLDFIICFLFFAPFFRLHFSSDAYSVLTYQGISGAGGVIT